MVKKARIGLGLFFSNTTNSGIVNYIYNIVAALNTLPEEVRPRIILIHNEEAEVELIKSVNYTDIEFVLFKSSPDNFLLRKINSFISKVFGKNLFLNRTIYRKIDCFYPYFPFINAGLSGAPNKIEWLVDFNNRLFPQHYEDNGEEMKRYQEELTKKKSIIVLSSESLLAELKHYYPYFKNDVRILRFACSLPDISNHDANTIMEKFGIDIRYFMSPNQFWEHKNQLIVLESIRLFKQRYPNLKFKVLFTGSLEVNRGKGLYVQKLEQVIKDYAIENYVCFLGVLDRRDQLVLMNESIALIQPSLYEGWSTLVEEAKALNKNIILSDIPVHREQIKDNGYFFNPSDSEELFLLMKYFLENKVDVIPVCYNLNIANYAKVLLQCFTSV